MDAYKHFHRLLKRDFSPVLRADGFMGSGNTFRRVKGERVDIVNVQGSLYGGKCCVNLASHFSFLPVGGGCATDLATLKQSDCTFRDRLHEASESDHWWTYGASDAETESSVASLVELYRRRGTLFFGKFEPFPEAFEQITPAEMDAGDFSRMPAAMTGVYAALTMARIMKHLGRLDKCRAFAEIGLRHLGHAIGLQAELEQLRGVF